jgi:pimeloyl-ACP methyl ester carboxylesterase
MLISASDGIKLEVRSVGSGAPLVFAHEFSSDARSWEAQVSHFSRHYRCTVYCAPGYPLSLPKIISARSDDAIQIELAWR